MTRPLGAFSDFIVCDFPHLLTTSPEEVEQGVDGALNDLTEAKIEMARQSDRRLAAYDLKILEWGLYHSGLPVPSRLMALVDDFCAGTSPALTYEELVLLNPEEDMRFFTTGAHRETERLFYNNHRESEKRLAVLIVRLKEALERNSFASLNADEFWEAWSFIVDRTREVGNMPDGHFVEFRRYFMPHTGRGVKGPSGAFSAKFPIFELLLCGNLLSERHLGYLHENWQYFPLDDIAELSRALDAAKEGRTIHMLAERLSEGRSFVEQCIKRINRWRLSHLTAARDQLPEAFSSTTTTGETNPEQFLRRRLIPPVKWGT